MKTKTAFTKTLVMFLSLAMTLTVQFPEKPIYASVPIAETNTLNQAEFRKAFFDASRIYGKAGCGDMDLAEMTAKHAIRTGLSANLIAAIVSIESSCDPLAISNRGAVGIMQVNVKVQSEKFAQFRTINLFNPEQGMSVGTDILAGMIKTWGLKAGVSHYNGSGPDAEAYAVKVLALAGK
jgi:soluble lytic murein transglycosylase-like protein